MLNEENQIDEKVSDINKITDISKLEEYKKEIDNLVQKKAKIAGDLSPKGSYLNQLIEEDGKAEIQCQFCDKRYEFNKEELEEILKRSK